MEEQIAKEAHHLQPFQADYQRLVGDSKEYEIVIQSAEQVITTARITIARAQALIEANEKKLAVTRNKLEGLETAKMQVQENLATHVSRLEFLQAQLVTKRFFRGRVAGPSFGRS